ncbi:hypothetical protein EfmAA290_02410 [Enterococcus faecium]|nr:hypothetical protein EfmAA290_02410 [Enterococcus faecium]
MVPGTATAALQVPSADAAIAMEACLILTGLHNGLGKLSIIPTSSPLVSFLMKKYRIILIV